jgi:hypothetical protein
LENFANFQSYPKLSGNIRVTFAWDLSFDFFCFMERDFSTATPILSAGPQGRVLFVTFQQFLWQLTACVL